MDKLIRKEFRIEEEFLQNAQRRILIIIDYKKKFVK